MRNIVEFQCIRLYKCDFRYVNQNVHRVEYFQRVTCKTLTDHIVRWRFLVPGGSFKEVSRLSIFSIYLILMIYETNTIIYSWRLSRVIKEQYPFNIILTSFWMYLVFSFGTKNTSSYYVPHEVKQLLPETFFSIFKKKWVIVKTRCKCSTQ